MSADGASTVVLKDRVCWLCLFIVLSLLVDIAWSSTKPVHVLG